MLDALMKSGSKLGGGASFVLRENRAVYSREQYQWTPQTTEEKEKVPPDLCPQDRH